MKKVLAVIIAILMLLAATPVSSFSKNKHKDKKHHFRLFRHKRRERLRKWNTGHTEFKNRTKRDRKRISRHHLKPEIRQKHKGKHKHHKGKGKAGKEGKEEQESKTPEDSGKDKETPREDNAPKENGEKSKEPPKEAPQPTPPETPPPAPPETPPPPPPPGGLQEKLR